MGWDNVITHMGYGDRFRKHRRWMHDGFQSKGALLGYRHVQRRETYTLLSGLLETPADFVNHIQRSVVTWLLLGAGADVRTAPYHLTVGRSGLSWK